MSPQPYVFPESASPQLKVIQDFFKYVTIFDFEKLSTLTTEDLVQKMRPASLGVPDRTRAELFAVLAQMRDSLNGKPLEITMYEVYDGLQKTWVYAKNEPFNLEFGFLFEFGVGPHALKIISFTEFVDSKRYLEINLKS
ncbi:hypothetical protein BJV77DRAFT_964026 [Russula vinacea]|nr:hypothetical protein BJV77DRAFT_964026 [Russula vinacea]